MSVARKCGLGLLIASVATLSLSATPALAEYSGGQNGALRVSPATVLPGQSVTVSGAGCARAANIGLSLQPTLLNLGSATADTSGSFSTTVIIPAAVTTGLHRAVAVCQAAQGGTLTLVSGVAVASSAAGTLPFSGTNAIPLTLSGGALVVLGAMVVLTVRRRRTN